ncbi:SubName: Full=Uncharacterized protein {ECO:0000313/EMBL:CCA70695.1} [Serendipita indica DSM 11827]|nr:SubName: Full=Uncharacterized protein {ECO:0000313/EMBL:CCA70695.1} [Serendipita indica DSM 11827]
MSSSAGLASYSSLFAAGLDPNRSAHYARPDTAAAPASMSRYKEFPMNIGQRRPSVDTDSFYSRRSSLPAWSPTTADMRLRRHPSSSNSQNISFTPSVLFRSDTTATRRTNLKSFLSLDANDQTLSINRVHNDQQSDFSRQTRAISVGSSAWLASLQSPFYASFANAPLSMTDTPFATDQTTSSTHSDAYAPTQPAPRHNSRMTAEPVSLDMVKASISDEPPRLEVRLDASSSRLSFDPSVQLAKTRGSVPSIAQSIPARPEYEPRVRSSVPSGSAMSSPPPVPQRAIHRNISIASASTFKSMTPSQRSAIKRSRRNEALARLEGNYYDPAPHVQANGSFMPFGSDEEEEEEEDDEEETENEATSPRRLPVSTPTSPPPAIKPPSPLRYRTPEPRKFVEVERPEGLHPIAEASSSMSPSTRAPKGAVTSSDQAPPIVVHQSMWPSLQGAEEDDDDGDHPFSTTPHQHQTPSRLATQQGPSPLSSKMNLSHHSAMNSTSSLSSFTPFSSVDKNRSRNPSIAGRAMSPSQGSIHSPQMRPYAESMHTVETQSVRSNDDASVESLSSEGGLASVLGTSDRKRRPQSPRTLDSRSRTRTTRPRQVQNLHIPVSASSLDDHAAAAGSVAANVPLSRNILNTTDASSSGWMSNATLSSISVAQAPSPQPTSPLPMNSKHSNEKGSGKRSRNKDVSPPSPPHAKAKGSKSKRGVVEYENWLDMSGDEKSGISKDGSTKKRRWLFGL